MGKTLLLADDSITIQKVVGIIFANEDFTLVVVDNGNAALEKARELRPEVLLIDAHMPGMTGYEVCSEVRRDPLLKDTPLLLLIGAFEHFDEERAKASGIDDHITKPFESQNLIDKVKALLDLGARRISAAPPPTQAVPEIPVSVTEESVGEPAAAAANLSESFRSFTHLAGEAQPAVETALTAPETISLGETAEAAPVTEAEQDSVIILSSVDIVEAGPEDDPWGTFTEEVVEGEAIQFGEVVEEDEHSTFDETVEEIEPFTLLDEDEIAPTPAESAVMGWAEFEPSPEEMPVEQEIFGIEEAPAPLPVIEPTVVAPPAEPPVAESIVLGEEPEPPKFVFSAPPPAQSPIVLKPEPDADLLQFAPEEEYIPADEVFAEQAEAAAAPAVPGEGATLTVTEEQLAAAISRISRELIEKIAWDVVPDLAEMIIKDEIRKIKEGMSR